MDDIETICENSYRNFHVKGFDYLCLSRTPNLTRKVYFFEGNLTHLPELVIPHNHRYNFTTTVLSGSLINKTYSRFKFPTDEPTQVFNEFEYMTPLNGGDGFVWKRETPLYLANRRAYNKHDHYYSRSNAIHTLDIVMNRTVIMLEQGRDVVPVGKPTAAFKLDGATPPSLDGLYDRMTPDHARMRLNQFLDLIGNRFWV